MLEAQEEDEPRVAELIFTAEAQRVFVAFASPSVMISSVPNSLKRNCKVEKVNEGNIQITKELI